MKHQLSSNGVFLFLFPSEFLWGLELNLKDFPFLEDFKILKCRVLESAEVRRQGLSFWTGEFVQWGWCYCLNDCLPLDPSIWIAVGEAYLTLMFFVIAKPTSFSLSQSRKGEPCSHFEEYLKPNVASSFSFLCCAVERLMMKDESFLFLSCECSSCFTGQIGWFLCVPFQYNLYPGERGRKE